MIVMMIKNLENKIEKMQESIKKQKLLELAVSFQCMTKLPTNKKIKKKNNNKKIVRIVE